MKQGKRKSQAHTQKKNNPKRSKQREGEKVMQFGGEKTVQGEHLLYTL